MAAAGVSVAAGASVASAGAAVAAAGVAAAGWADCGAAQAHSEIAMTRAITIARIFFTMFPSCKMKLAAPRLA